MKKVILSLVFILSIGLMSFSTYHEDTNKVIEIEKSIQNNLEESSVVIEEFGCTVVWTVYSGGVATHRITASAATCSRARALAAQAYAQL